MKHISDKNMYLFSELKDLINKCNCKNDNFEVDIENNIIVSKSIDTIKHCSNDCGLITRVTMYLITNDIDYDMLDDFSIKLKVES